MHVGNKEKDILIFGEGPTQGLVDTTLNMRRKMSYWFYTIMKKVNIIMEETVCYLLMLQKHISSKQKLRNNTLCIFFLGNIYEDFTVSNTMKMSC